MCQPKSLYGRIKEYSTESRLRSCLSVESEDMEPDPNHDTFQESPRFRSGAQRRNELAIINASSARSIHSFIYQVIAFYAEKKLDLYIHANFGFIRVK